MDPFCQQQRRSRTSSTSSSLPPATPSHTPTATLGRHAHQPWNSQATSPSNYQPNPDVLAAGISRIRAEQVLTEVIFSYCNKRRDITSHFRPLDYVLFPLLQPQHPTHCFKLLTTSAQNSWPLAYLISGLTKASNLAASLAHPRQVHFRLARLNSAHLTLTKLQKE